MRPRLYSTRALPISFSTWASPGYKNRHVDPTWFLFSLWGTGQKKRFSEVVSWNKKQFSPNSPNSPWPKTWLPSPKLAYHQDLCCTLPAFITLTKTLLMLKVCVQQLKQSSAQSDGKTVKKKQKWLMMTHRNPGGQAEVSQRILTGIKCTLGTIKIRSSQSA